MTVINQQEDEDVYIETSSQFPKPEKTLGDKHMWTINGYRIWAKTYQEALKHLVMIESF